MCNRRRLDRVYREVEARTRLNREFRTVFYHSWITDRLVEDFNEYRDAFKMKAVSALLMTVWAATNKGSDQIAAANTSTKGFFKSIPYIAEEVKQREHKEDSVTKEDSEEAALKASNPGRYLMEKFLKSRGQTAQSTVLEQ